MIVTIGVVLGIIIFLIAEHPIAFWCLFVPLIVTFIVALVGWMKSGSPKFSGLILAMGILWVMIVSIVLVCAN